MKKYITILKIYLFMSKKSIGTNAERELLKKFWAAGWAAIRSAGSGSMHFPSPDLLVGNKIRRLAIEVKYCSSDNKYFPKIEIKQLKNFAQYFGAESWVAIKFSRMNWVFVSLEDLYETNSNFVFSRKNLTKGLSFEEIINASIY